MKRNKFYLFYFLLVTLNINAQSIKFFLHFNEKVKVKSALSLSQKAIKRKDKFNIPLDQTDYAINREYLARLNAVDGVHVLLVSRWLNGAVVESELSEVVLKKKIDFVDNIVILKDRLKINNNENILSQEENQSYNYGSSLLQIKNLSADKMHDNCLDGTGVLIAVFDGGFENAQNTSSLIPLFTQNRIKYTFNVIDNNTDVFLRHVHGTNVLSCLGGFSPGKLIGTGYGADFALFITEDVKSEKIIEEYYWLKAAEISDSLGVDIISSSLGYYDFDDKSENHKLEELDGKTSVITKAAAIAARKGILVVNSAGNNYTDNNWRKITFPSDADSILSVGSIDGNGNRSPFSAIGPTQDGRIKPDVCALGTNVIVNNNNNFFSASGTSYSAPLIAGLAAGLWQSNPLSTNIDIRNALINSSSQSSNPNFETGYGVPNFFVAHRLLNNKNPEPCLPVISYIDYTLFPNPADDYIIIDKIDLMTNNSYLLLDLNGKEILRGNLFLNAIGNVKLDISSLEAGVYILKIGEKLNRIMKL